MTFDPENWCLIWFNRTKFFFSSSSLIDFILTFRSTNVFSSIFFMLLKCSASVSNLEWISPYEHNDWIKERKWEREREREWYFHYTIRGLWSIVGYETWKVPFDILSIVLSLSSMVRKLCRKWKLVSLMDINWLLLKSSSCSEVNVRNDCAGNAVNEPANPCEIFNDVNEWPI